jgi:hypothetical protein
MLLFGVALVLQLMLAIFTLLFVPDIPAAIQQRRTLLLKGTLH